MIALGIDQLLGSYRHLIRGKRVGLISHYHMTDAWLVPVIDRLLMAEDVILVRLFGPEHGVLNAAREGESVSSTRDAHSGLETVSLYGHQMAPPPASLEDLDVLAIDLQDIGSRYYTTIGTLYCAMQASERQGIPLVVLDRPNPIGGTRREGHLLQPQYQSFVSMLPVPIRHGLTLGELATLAKAWYFRDADLKVVPAIGWKRETLWPDTGLPFVPPSPNTTGFAMTLLYPGTCLFEGTNVSLGRGTPHPFEWIGAPWADGHALADWFNAQRLEGVRARPVYFAPSRPPYAGEVLKGVHLHITDPRHIHALRTGVTLLRGFRTLYPDTFAITTSQDGTHPRFFDLLAGGTDLRTALESEATDDYFAAESDIVEKFQKQVANLLLYS